MSYYTDCCCIACNGERAATDWGEIAACNDGEWLAGLNEVPGIDGGFGDTCWLVDVVVVVEVLVVELGEIDDLTDEREGE